MARFILLKYLHSSTYNWLLYDIGPQATVSKYEWCAVLENKRIKNNKVCLTLVSSKNFITFFGAARHIKKISVYD